MKTEQAKQICDTIPEIFSDMSLELVSDDDISSLAEMIEDFFLGNYNLFLDDSYPDWEEVAIHVFSSQWERLQQLD